MIRKTLILITALFPLVAVANIGGHAGSFLRLGATARSVALGGGLTGAMDNGFVAYHNPAAVAFLEKRHVSVFNHFLPLDRYLVSASFAASLPPTGGLGVGVVNAGVDDIEGRDLAGHKTGTVSTAEYALFFSFSNQFIEGMSVGVNVKIFQHTIDIDENPTGKGMGVDVGIMIHRFEKFDFGLVVQDLNSAYAWKTEKIFDDKGRTYRDRFPLQVRAGFAYHPGIFHVIGDYTYFSTEDATTAHRVRLGGEYEPSPQVAIRAGINNFSPAVGIGLNYSLLKRNDAHVDYAFVLGGSGEGISHVFTYVFTF